ncbi:MAG: hypothetical protein EOS78_14670 [Mesorhizobium sp.]|nr:MAG: hypothetical protein EOS78_14670 [Mesorhizobium sp.]
MLFSKYEFLQLPRGDNFYTRIYDDSAGDDSHAAKAVCIVQINYPTDNVTLAFTHLQASYVNDTEHSDVRSRQIDSVFGANRAAKKESDKAVISTPNRYLLQQRSCNRPFVRKRRMAVLIHRAGFVVRGRALLLHTDTE